MNIEVDPQLIIEELKAQRNALADQLAIAGAIISKLTAEKKPDPPE